VTWTDQARAIPLPDVLAALGTVPMSRGSYGPCPACGIATRGSEDKRGPLGLGSGRYGWRCHRCDASGDGLKAVTLRVGGFPLARGWYADRGWCDPERDHQSRPVPPPPKAPPPPPLAPPPDPRELADLLSRCTAADPTWTDRRMVATLPGLVGCLPESAPLPPWARSRAGSWHASGHVALVPCWGLQGQLLGIRARAPGPRTDGTPKALPPSGRSMPRAMMANPTARAWLRGGDAPPAVVLVEGEPAWVRWSHAAPEAAVMGFVSGSWSPEWAERIRGADAPVVVVTDHDPAGDKYAAAILASVPRAWRWEWEKDDTDATSEPTQRSTT